MNQQRPSVNFAGSERMDFDAIGADDWQSDTRLPASAFSDDYPGMLNQVLENMTKLLACPKPQDFQPTWREDGSPGD